jgi:hypothetical protein
MSKRITLECIQQQTLFVTKDWKHGPQDPGSTRASQNSFKYPAALDHARERCKLLQMLDLPDSQLSTPDLVAAAIERHGQDWRARESAAETDAP